MAGLLQREKVPARERDGTGGDLHASGCQRAERAIADVHEFLAIHLSEIIKGPKVQESIKVVVETFLDSGMRRFNSYHRFMTL